MREGKSRQGRQRKEEQVINPTKLLPLPFLRFLLDPVSQHESFHSPWYLVIAFYKWLLRDELVWTPQQLSSLLPLSMAAIKDMELTWPSPTSKEAKAKALPSDLEEQIDSTLASYIIKPPHSNVKPVSRAAVTSYIPRGFRREGYDAQRNMQIPARSESYRSNRHNTFRVTGFFKGLEYMHQTCYWNMVGTNVTTSVETKADPLLVVIKSGNHKLDKRLRYGNSRYMDIFYVDFSFSNFNHVRCNTWKLGELLARFHVISFEYCTMSDVMRWFIIGWTLRRLPNPDFFKIHFTGTCVCKEDFKSVYSQYGHKLVF